MKFTIYQESRIGKRANNEDRLAHCYSRDALLMVIADGMGGHYYGEVAAQIAVQTLAESFQREATPELRDPFMFLQKALSNAHHAIADGRAEASVALADGALLLSHVVGAEQAAAEEIDAAVGEIRTDFACVEDFVATGDRIAHRLLLNRRRSG